MAKHAPSRANHSWIEYAEWIEQEQQQRRRDVSIRSGAAIPGHTRAATHEEILANKFWYRPAADNEWAQLLSRSSGVASRDSHGDDGNARSSNSSDTERAEEKRRNLEKRRLQIEETQRQIEKRREESQARLEASKAAARLREEQEHLADLRVAERVRCAPALCAHGFFSRERLLHTARDNDATRGSRSHSCYCACVRVCAALRC